MFKRLALILAIPLLFLAQPVKAADFLLLDGVQTTITSSSVSFLEGKFRGPKAFWVYIAGTASVAIDVAPRPGAAFVPLVENVTVTSLIDTIAPAQRAQVRVVSCVACTVSVLLQVE
jgi:hypothetical protein